MKEKSENIEDALHIIEGKFASQKVLGNKNAFTKRYGNSEASYASLQPSNGANRDKIGPHDCESYPTQSVTRSNGG